LFCRLTGGAQVTIAFGCKGQQFFESLSMVPAMYHHDKFIGIISTDFHNLMGMEYNFEKPYE